ncbi:MAG: hypothetical protein ACR2P3_11765, partial [Geminicoccaceae bacterium]
SATATAPDKLDGVLFTILFVLVATVITAPLAVIDTPLLADYPNHVARMHVIGNVDNDFLLAERYAIHFEFIPNIIMDLMVPWLTRMIPLDIAARIFLAACLVSTLASVAWLHRVLFNQWSFYSLVAALFAYHGSMMAGMANFSLGIGLVPAALAVWIRIRGARPAWRLLIGSLIALGLFFCHLVAVGAYGLLVFGFELAYAFDRKGRQAAAPEAARDIAVAGATGLLPLFLFSRLIFGGEGGSATAGLVFGNAAWKLKALLAPLANYNLPLDLLSFALIAGLALVAWRTGRLEVERRMVPGLTLLAITFVLAPKALWTGGVFDQRLAILLALMLVACTRFNAPSGPLRLLLPAMLALLLAVRIGVVTSAWIDHRADLAEMRRAIEMVGPGSRILVARPDKDAGHRQAPARHRVFHHAVQLTSLPALAVIEKSAFVSTLYALPGQQPLMLKPPFDELGGRGHVDLPTLNELTLAYRPDEDDPPTRRQIRDWPRDFDYVVLIYGYGAGAAELAGELPLEPLLDGEILDLFRIVDD